MGYVYGRARRTSETHCVRCDGDAERFVRSCSPLLSRSSQVSDGDGIQAIICAQLFRENIIKTARCNKGSRLLFFSRMSKMRDYSPGRNIYSFIKYRCFAPSPSSRLFLSLPAASQITFISRRAISFPHWSN